MRPLLAMALVSVSAAQGAPADCAQPGDADRLEAAAAELIEHLDRNDLGAFRQRLASGVRAECLVLIQDRLYQRVYEYELGLPRSGLREPGARLEFLRALLEAGARPLFRAADVCGSIANLSRPTFGRHATPMAAQFLARVEGRALSCSLAPALEWVAAAGDTGLLAGVLTRERRRLGPAAADPDGEFAAAVYRAMEAAAGRGQVSALRLLDDHRPAAGVGTEPAGALYRAAARGGDVATFRLLRDAGFVLDAADPRLLVNAVAGGSLEMVDHLLALGVPVPSESHQAQELMGWLLGPEAIARFGATEPMYLRLRERGFRLDRIEAGARYDLLGLALEGAEAAQRRAAAAAPAERDWAASHLRLLDRLVEDYLRSGPDLELRDARDKTLLMLAVEAQLPEAVRAGLARGADPQARDRHGRSALDLARGRASLYLRGGREDPGGRRLLEALRVIQALGGDLDDYPRELRDRI